MDAPPPPPSYQEVRAAARAARERERERHRPRIGSLRRPSHAFVQAISGWGSVLATAGGARSTGAGTATTAAADSPTLRAALALLLCAAAQTQQQQAPAAAAPAAPAEPGAAAGAAASGAPAAPLADAANVNHVVDALLAAARDALLDAGLDRAPLPDVCETFSQPMARGLVVVRGAVEARAGWVSQLSSVHRTGDATLERAPGGGATLTASLGLANLSAGYDACEVRVKPFQLAGAVRADVASNSVRLVLDVRARPGAAAAVAAAAAASSSPWGGGAPDASSAASAAAAAACELRVRELRVCQLGGVRVRVRAGGRPAAWLLSRLATAAARRLRADLAAAVERRLQEAAARALDALHFGGASLAHDLYPLPADAHAHSHSHSHSHARAHAPFT